MYCVLVGGKIAHPVHMVRAYPTAGTFVMIYNYVLQGPSTLSLSASVFINTVYQGE